MRKEDAIHRFKMMGGRMGLANRVLEIATEIVEARSPKRSVAGAGQIRILAEIAMKADDYWHEVEARGSVREDFFTENPELRTRPLLGPDGNLSQAHWDREEAQEKKEAGRERKSD